MLMASVGRDRCGGGTRGGASFRRAQREMEKAENKPPPSQNPAAKRKREERARGAASKHNEVVHRTGKGMKKSAPEANRAGRKVAAPTSPRPLKSGLGTWQREKTPVGVELDVQATRQLKERRRRVQERAEKKVRKEIDECAARETPIDECEARATEGDAADESRNAGGDEEKEEEEGKEMNEEERELAAATNGQAPHVVCHF